MSAATGGADAVCAKAEKPKLPASKGSVPVPFNIVRRVTVILALPVIFQYLSCALGALIATQRLDRTRLSQASVRWNHPPAIAVQPEPHMTSPPKRADSITAPLRHSVFR